MARYLKSEYFNFEFLRVLHGVPFQHADVGECMDALLDIKDLDGPSWFNAWQKAAAKTEILAKQANADGDKEAEKWALLRTSHYLSMSENMLHVNPSDDRILPVSEKSIDFFQRGMSLLDSKVYKLEIPYEDYTLPAYLYMPTDESRLDGKIPLIVQTCGFDSSHEELYLFVAAGARHRGYATLTFDGPGQGIVMRKLKKAMRPDWEVVIGKVIDYAFELSASHPELELDLDRLTLTGNSMGGYYSLRGAVDPRVKACISTDGFYDMWLIVDSRLPRWLTGGLESGWIKESVFNAFFDFAASYSVQLAWEFRHAMMVFQVDSPAKVLTEFKKYTLRPNGKEHLSRITCPVMITGAADTLYFQPEISTDLIWENLAHLGDHNREMWIARGVGQGGLQAKIGAMAIAHQKMFAWLDVRMDMKRQRGVQHALPTL